MGDNPNARDRIADAADRIAEDEDEDHQATPAEKRSESIRRTAED